MCFRFDGENAVAAYRMETCGERLAGEGVFTPSPTTPSGEPGGRAAAAVEVPEAGQARLDAREAD
ncbi:hypothetical protein EN794_030510 [Mesorhizobium sp. M00.F.Ca.ET.151.01.1.1]|nr:hypothetical protein EN794_030510 [Mesorhizobium sp. M00.F.Ca.ET.151.01.1.1]